MKRANIADAALVIVDMVNKYDDECVNPAAKSDQRIETINRAAEIFRNNWRPVIHVKSNEEVKNYAGDNPDGLLPGIVYKPSDKIYYKCGMGAFDQGSQLGDILRKERCHFVVVAGMLTQYCVMGTYYGAIAHGFEAYLLKDGVLAWEDKYNDAAYLLCDSVDIESLSEGLSYHYFHSKT